MRNGTVCTSPKLEFQGHFRRKVEADFGGGRITTDAGGLVLREVAQRTGILDSFAKCFSDHRHPVYTIHSVEQLVAQRVYALCLGYEDLNDHDQLRRDPLFALLTGKRDIEEEAPAGKSTLSRLERTPETVKGRAHKIVCDTEKVEKFFIDTYLKLEKERPQQIILDLDATDLRLHGEQEGKFFHGYYGHYCYLPLYIFAGDHLLVAKVRKSDIDASAGALEEVQRIVPRLREKWPGIKIILRADSGFARDSLMSWCEENAVDYVFGLARNARLEKILEPSMACAQKAFSDTQVPQRQFVDFHYETLDSWSRARRVIGKAEYLPKGPNPRFIVTSLGKKAHLAMSLYEEMYCARGDMENRIKEQLELFADRVSSETMRANQLRVWFSALAYTLMAELRRTALRATALAKAQMSTIRLKLLKIGAIITTSARRVYLRLASGYPYKDILTQALSAVT